MKIKPTPETIWKRPAYLPYVHSRLTEKAILKAEKQLGHELPQEFLDVLRVQNGGPIRFSIPDSMGDMIAGIGRTFPSITDYHMEDFQDCVDFSLDGLVPFDGDGHWYNCLDFRNTTGVPSVWYIDIECNGQYQIATSFSEYVNLLELNIENELVLSNVASIEDAIERLEALFCKQFEYDVSTIGIPHWTCKTGRKRDEIFWISPNKVARGYSGDDPDCFRFVGKALLFPELPPNAVIFECPEGHLETYRTRLREAGFDLLDIHDAAT